MPEFGVDQDTFERCVERVRGQGGAKNAYAVCIATYTKHHRKNADTGKWERKPGHTYKDGEWSVKEAVEEQDIMEDRALYTVTEGGEVTVEEAEWSAAAQNDLPDSSFAYVEPGGEKDDEGKTVPRGLRHYPYKDASGKVDLPHLRNALARAAQQIKKGGEGADAARKAMSKLQAAAKSAGVGERGKEEKEAYVAEVWPSSFMGEKSLDAAVEEVRTAFYNHVGRDSRMWIREIFEKHVIVTSEDGGAYAIPYTRSEAGGIGFADASQWKRVKMTWTAEESTQEAEQLPSLDVYKGNVPYPVAVGWGKVRGSIAGRVIEAGSQADLLAQMHNPETWPTEALSQVESDARDIARFYVAVGAAARETLHHREEKGK